MSAAWEQSALVLLGQALPVFALIMVRTIGVLQQAPIIGAKTVPAMVRAGLALALSLVYFWTLKSAPVVPHQLLAFVLAALVEFGTGYLFGMAAMILFYAFQAAGEMVATATGLSMMTTLNPSMHMQTTAVGNLFFYLSQTAFLAIGGELWFLSAYYQTFQLVPLGGFQLNLDVWNHAGNIVLDFFYIAIQLAMPAIVVMFLVDFGLGIINRAAPSVSNILQIVMNVKPTVGFVLMALMVPNVVSSIGQWSDRLLLETQALVLAQVQPTPAPTPAPSPSPGP